MFKKIIGCLILLGFLSICCRGLIQDIIKYGFGFVVLEMFLGITFSLIVLLGIKWVFVDKK